MGVAVDLLDGIVAKLNETTFGTAVVSRSFLPEVERRGLTPRIIVTLAGKESFELDRGSEAITYKVDIGLTYPTTSEAEIDDCFDMIESIQDWLCRRDNKNFSTATNTFKLNLPVVMTAPFDRAMQQEASVFFTTLSLNYIYYKNRTP